MTEHELILTTCYFVLAMVGHFVGDYLFQTQWMATNKSRRDPIGWAACYTHVVLYTLSVYLFIFLAHGVFLLAQAWMLLLIIGVPHYLIDHYSVASYLLKWKNGVMPFEVVTDSDTIGYTNHNGGPSIVRVHEDGIKAMWKVGFGAPVYIINDNTLHFVMLYFTCMALVKGWL